MESNENVVECGVGRTVGNDIPVDRVIAYSNGSKTGTRMDMVLVR